jgi:hypothetical protein
VGLTSEHVHWILGGAVVSITLVLLLQELEVIKARWSRYLLGLATIAIGIELLIDRLVHGDAAPRDYEAETLQHVGQGLLVAAVGVIESLRAHGRLRHPAWAFGFPIAVAVVALVFFFHAQHQAAGPAALLVVQHRIFGATLMVAAVAKALAEIDGPRMHPFRVGWLVVALVAGLELLLYSEDGGQPASAPASHVSH